MEALYVKLFERYTNLKRNKDYAMEEHNRDQESKFAKQIIAADKLIEHLIQENDALRLQNNDLRSEIASMRSVMDKQYAESQELMMEEIQKNRELSEEIERLQVLQQTGKGCSSREHSEDREVSAPRSDEVVSGGKSATDRTRKRSRHLSDQTKECLDTPCSSCPVDLTVSIDVEKNQNMQASGASGHILLPECCKRAIVTSGADGHEVGTANCLFQILTECLIGLKLSAGNQTEGICISALHQSSGYSFSLTWANKAGSDEAELLYRVSSLGTFDKVAPEWMRQVIVFSMSMCPVFFERLSRVVKLGH